MFTLICAKCGCSNPIENEFVTFCKSCKKKFPNSFQELKKSNPQLNLDLYRKKYGTPVTRSARLSLIPPEIRRKKKLRILAIILSIIIIAILASATYFLGLPGKKTSANIETSADKVFANWKRKNYGSFGLSLQSPIDLKKEEMFISNEKIIHIVKAEAYNGQHLSGANIGTQMVMYSPGVHVDLEDAKLQVLQEISSNTGVSKFQHSEIKHKSIAANKATVFEGSFELYGNKLYFKHLVAVQNNVVLEVYINYSDSPENRDIATKVLKSVKIQEPKN